MKKIGKPVSQRGMILISFYLLLVAALVLCAGLVAHAVAEIRGAQRSQASMQALYLAEAGVDWAISQLRGNLNWAGGGQSGSTGTYGVTVAGLGSSRYRLTVQGTADQGVAASRSIEAIVEVNPDPLFRYAMFGGNSVSLIGNVFTDSYNSSQGPYNPTTAGMEGDIGTNGTSAGNVTLTGNTWVKGDAFVGAGANPNSVITTTDNAQISGIRDDLDTPSPLTPVTVPGGLTNRGGLSIFGNNTVTLPGGSYWYSSISITGNGRLNFAGPATVYVSGSVNVGGNGIGTSSNRPPNLLMYVQGAGTTVQFAGNAAFYGAVYAPQSAVNVNGDGSFYGAIVGQTARGTGSRRSVGIHYDLALQQVAGGGENKVEVLSWRDLSG